MSVKKYLKKICYLLGLQYQGLKFKEICMRIFFQTDKRKEVYIQKKFKQNLGYEIDFSKKPETFNQKIQFRKLYDKNPLYRICADKFRVREYVRQKIGEEYLIPLHLVTDKLTMEQWQQLPDSFVAKANHNSGPVQIVKDKNKTDALKIIRELNNQLKIDYGVLSMEQYYSDIPRKIIVEKYLSHIGDTLEDFKFHVFGKENKVYIEHITDRLDNGSIYENFYSEDWKKLDFAIGAKFYSKEVKPPENLKKMVEIAKILGQDFDYVRVDLYNVATKIYFGELTFCGDSGYGKFSSEVWDYKLGKCWKQAKLK